MDNAFPAIVLFTGIFIGIILAVRQLKRHSKELESSLAACPGCGAKMRVTAIPEEAQLVATCLDEGCGGTTHHPVRASALSLFGLAQILFGAAGAGILYVLAMILEWSNTVRMGLAVAGFIAAFLAARAGVRNVAHHIAKSDTAPLGWREEAVSHLAPSPFAQSKQNDEPS